VLALGVRLADAEHIADAIGMDCDIFLTNDRRLRNRSAGIQDLGNLPVRRPSEFLAEAVQAGAPSPTTVPWPWEIIDDFANQTALRPTSQHCH
jgi:hypothetical protein